MSLLSLIKLKAACERKRWNTSPLYENVLRKFTDILSNLPESHSELVLELVDKYRWMDHNEIFSSLVAVLRKVPKERLEGCNRIIAFPIMQEKHQNNVKSGHFALYLIKGVTPYLDEYDNINVLEVIRFEDMARDKYQPKLGDLIFLIDDYIGSGDTVRSTIETLRANNDLITEEMLFILTIAVQNDSIEPLQELGLPLYFDHVELKGISNNYDPETAKKKLELMLEIESLIPKCEKYSLGYNKSEALITLVRTPNNTFPLFWKTIQIKSKYYKAPFPRY